MISKALAKATKSLGFFVDARDILQDIELTNIEHNTVKLMSLFFDKYSRLPSREELLLFLPELPEAEDKFIPDYRKFINQVYADDVASIDEKVLLAELKERGEKERLKDRIISMADTFDARSSKEITEEMVKAIFQSKHGFDLGKIEVDVADLEKTIPIIKYHDTERIRTGIKGMDKATYGGVGVRELWTFIAPSGRGKTIMLINLMYGFMAQGYSVLYITMEMSIIDILRRLYRRVLYRDKDFMAEGNEAIIKEWVKKFFGMTHGAGRVQYYPANSFSAEDLKAELMKFEYKGDFMPQVVIIDHLDLMISKTKSIRQQDAPAYWRLIVDDLHGIPISRGIPIVLATQAKQTARDKVLVTEADSGESYGKVQSSDVVPTLNQTSEEYDARRLRVAFPKNRDNAKNTMVELFYDPDMMLMCDLEFATTNGWI